MIKTEDKDKKTPAEAQGLLYLVEGLANNPLKNDNLEKTNWRQDGGESHEALRSREPQKMPKK